jgi:hypothetical protein
MCVYLLWMANLKFADGDGGMQVGKCPNRAESSALNDKTKSLVLVNYFSSIPFKITACEHNSADLINMLRTCFGAAGNRWANFVAVDFYKVPSNFLPRLFHSFYLGRIIIGWSLIPLLSKDKKKENINEGAGMQQTH